MVFDQVQDSVGFTEDPLCCRIRVTLTQEPYMKPTVTDIHCLNEPRQRFLNLWEATYLDHTGKVRKWQFASRNETPKPNEPPRSNAVICVCLYGDRLLITKEARIVVGGEEWGFPAGLQDGDESPEEAARREVTEETGLTVKSIFKISPTTPSSAGALDEAATYVFCEVEGTLSNAFLEPSECIESYLLTYEQVVKLCNREAPYDTGVISGRAWPLLYMYERLGHF